MDTARILTIIDKEWAEIFKNRMVLATIGFMPLIFTIMPLVMLYFTGTTGDISGDMADMPPQFTQACGDLNASDCIQYFVLNQFMLMFMMMPLMIPTAIAAYSIVGEKTTRSLEPLLATPITTEELLTAKALAAAIPAIIASWSSFFIFVLLMPLVKASPALIAQVLSPTWLIAVLIIGPLMAVAAVNMAVLVSSRVNDPRVAEQISAVLIVPIMAVMFAQIGGLLVVNRDLMMISAAVMLVVDAALIYAGARIFQRETILTRWK